MYEAMTAEEKFRRFSGFLTIENAEEVFNGIVGLFGNRSYVFVSTRGVISDEHDIPTVEVRTGQRMRFDEYHGKPSLTYYAKNDSGGWNNKVDGSDLSIVESVHISWSAGGWVTGIHSYVKTQEEAYLRNKERPGSVPFIHVNAYTSASEKMTIDQHAPCGDAIRWIMTLEPEPFGHLRGEIPTPLLVTEPLATAQKFAEQAVSWYDPNRKYAYLGIKPEQYEKLQRVTELLAEAHDLLVGVDECLKSPHKRYKSQ